MIQQNGDTEKCRRASTYRRHPFLEWYMPEPAPNGYSGEYQREQVCMLDKMKQNKHPELMPHFSREGPTLFAPALCAMSGIRALI